MTTPKVCKKCKLVIGWYNQEFRGNTINKINAPKWDCPMCRENRNITKLMGDK